MKDNNKDENNLEKREEMVENKTKEKKHLYISVGNLFLVFLVILMIGTASLVYYLISTMEAELKQNSISESKSNNVVQQQVSNNKNETIKNMIDSALNDSTSTNTVNAVDANDRKVMNENLIVLYNGLILDTSKMGKTELEYIDSSDKYKDKYVITYNNYESFSFKDAKLGILSEQIYDGLIGIENVSKIAISESYNAIPRTVKVVNSIPTVVSDKNQKIGEFDSKKAIIVDLDGNGTDEYILILANKTTGYSKIVLMDSVGTKVADLAYIEKSKWESVATEEYHLSLSNVEVVDIDNDGIMEILIELPKYEGDPSISLLKYKNGELQGDTNIECSLLP